MKTDVSQITLIINYITTMIETRKDMWAYIHEDMKRNLISGGGKVVDKDTVESTALLHRESETL